MTESVKQTFEIAGNSTVPVSFSGFEFYLSKRAASSAIGVLTLTGNAANTNTVVIGGKTYTFLTTLTQLDGSVLRGANASASIDNLIAAINLGPGAGGFYGAPTTLHPSVVALAGTGDTMDALAKEVGTSGNAIAVSETLTSGSWAPTSFLGDGAFGALEQNNNFVITLPTSPEDGLNYKYITLDNGITEVNGINYFTNWEFRSSVVNGFVLRKGDRQLITIPSNNQPFTQESIVMGFSNATQSPERRYEIGESIEFTFEKGKWRGLIPADSNIVGIGDI